MPFTVSGNPIWACQLRNVVHKTWNEFQAIWKSHLGILTLKKLHNGYEFPGEKSTHHLLIRCSIYPFKSTMNSLRWCGIKSALVQWKSPVYVHSLIATRTSGVNQPRMLACINYNSRRTNIRVSPHCIIISQISPAKWAKKNEKKQSCTCWKTITKWT